VLFPFVVLAFRDFSSLRSQFWPFSQVLRKIWRFVTRKVWRTAADTDVTDGFLDWRPTRTPYNWMPDWASWVRQPPEFPTRLLCYRCNPGPATPEPRRKRV